MSFTYFDVCFIYILQCTPVVTFLTLNYFNLLLLLLLLQVQHTLTFPSSDRLNWFMCVCVCYCGWRSDQQLLSVFLLSISEVTSLLMFLLFVARAGGQGRDVAAWDDKRSRMAHCLRFVPHSIVWRLRLNPDNRSCLRRRRGRTRDTEGREGERGHSARPGLRPDRGHTGPAGRHLL